MWLSRQFSQAAQGYQDAKHHFRKALKKEFEGCAHMENGRSTQAIVCASTKADACVVKCPTWTLENKQHDDELGTDSV